MYQLLFFALGLMLTGQCDGNICQITTTTGIYLAHLIPASCPTFEWDFSTSLASNLFFTARPFLTETDYCEVYNGTDTTGVLFGRIDKYQIGPVLTTSSQIFITCIIEHTQLVKLRTQRNLPDLCGTMPIDSLPATITSINYPMNYSDSTVCIWEYTTPLRHKFIFDFTLFFYENFIDYLYIIPDANDSSRQFFTGRRAPFQFETEGNGFQLITTADPSGGRPGFSVEITAVPLETLNVDVSCQEEINIIFGINDLANLTYESGDVLYISNTRQNDLDSIPSICKTDDDSPAFNFSFSQCEATYKNDGGGRLNVSFIVWNFKALDSSQTVQRYVFHSLTITCDFNASYAMESVAIKPQLPEIEEVNDPSSAQFEVNFNLYSDSEFNSPLSENDLVVVPQSIFAKVKLHEALSESDDIIIQLEDCWATQVENPNSVPFYPIIDNGCKAPPSDNEPSNAKDILQNYESSYAAFKFDSFVWTNFSDNDQAIYVHCDITICQNSTGLCPGKVCVTLKRRAAGNKVYQRMSVGPIRLANTKTYKSDDVQEKEFSKDNSNLLYIVLPVFIATLFGVVVIVTKKK